MTQGRKSGNWRKLPQPPKSGEIASKATSPLNLLTLDRFSEADLSTWERISGNLDELSRVLFFSLEPERLRRQQELIDALNEKPSDPIEFQGWVRVVDTRWTLSPLSAIGSLKSIGGRFNIGQDISAGARHPFPALYLAQDFATGYRERFQLAQDARVSGLTPEELALGASVSSYRIRGRIGSVFDASNLNSLSPVARVLARFKVPAEAISLGKQLGLNVPKMMVRDVNALYNALLQVNWRMWPTQYELPAPSQIFGDLVRLAGYEAISYGSTKSQGGRCLAVLSANLGSSSSFVELMDPADPQIRNTRLDIDTADDLAGWECIAPSKRPRVT
jgi:hypothetical protein